MSVSQLNTRIPKKLKEDITQRAKFSNTSVNRLVQQVLEDYVSGDLVHRDDIVDEEFSDDPDIDSWLTRMFKDDKRFDILEWITDEPGRGESSFNVSVRVRSGTYRMMETIISDPNCPHVTVSDFLRDAILTVCYIAMRGRLQDQEGTEWAIRERAVAKTASKIQRHTAIEQMLKEVESMIDPTKGTTLGNFHEDHAREGYERVADLIVADVPNNLENYAWALLRKLRSLLRDEDRAMLDEKDKYGPIVAVLEEEKEGKE